MVNRILLTSFPLHAGRHIFPKLRWLAVVTLAVLLGACAHPAMEPDESARLQRHGRFSLTVIEAGDTVDAIQGGFAWKDTGHQVQVDLSNPLGSTLARITVGTKQAELQYSDGRREVARSPDALAAKVLGNPIPVSGLRYWLHGQTSEDSHGSSKADTVPENDTQEFTDAGWHVNLSQYDAQGPTRLLLERREGHQQLKLRLVVNRAS